MDKKISDPSFPDKVTGWDFDLEFFPRRLGDFRLWYYEVQPNDGTKYEIMVAWDVKKIGFPTAPPYYSNAVMHLIIYRTGYYLFNADEFEHFGPPNIEYVSEKLKCSYHTAEIIMTFVRDLTAMNAKTKLLDPEHKELMSDCLLKRNE
jgi:hypothetical protein